jgi:curved DNA-binding protein CbpA
MADLPDYYSDLGVKPGANQQEIDAVYRKRVAELRVSKVEDAPEELGEVEAAYAVLRDSKKRTEYDAKLQLEDEKDESDFAKRDPVAAAYLKQQHRRAGRNRRTGSWLGALLDLFK